MRLHADFLAGRIGLQDLAIRAVVAESWQRSRSGGVDPLQGEAPSDGAGLVALRAASTLAPALPLIRRLLVDHAEEAGVVVAVADAAGNLLWVEGDRSTRSRAERMNFAAGANWSERCVGTNAPGTALALDREIHIRGAEHFCEVAQRFSCAAVPIHDSVTNKLLGVIDVTGGPEVDSLKSLSLVRATAVAVEKYLAVLRQPGLQAAPSRSPTIRVLGFDRPFVESVHDGGRVGTVTLAPRHADILVLLGNHADGLSAEELSVMLDEKELDVGTVRAEVSRMRRVLPGLIGSRPYRLMRPVNSDMAAVLDALDRRDAADALDHYGGALLPRSTSPAIAGARTELSSAVRTAVLATGDLALLRRWLDLPEGRDDRDGWRLLHNKSEAGSISRAQARGHLVALDLDLG
ncbi:transcriptional regulator [Mycobacterium sp. MS1601]|nr:transcriptional regulator [Mycobacterium sp. MS1601]